MINQLNGDYEAKGEYMRRYLERAKEIAGKFDTVELTQIPREDNHLANLLSRRAAS